MLRPKIILLLILAFVLLSLTNRLNETTTKFRSKVDHYVNSLSPNFLISSETLSAFGNNIVLNTKVRTKWKKEVTLVHKAKVENEWITYPKLYYGFYQYSNKNKCSIALDSLLNCFGNDCAKIKWNNENVHISSMPSIYIINDTEIIVCKVQPTYEYDFWNSTKSELLNKFKKEISRIIRINHKGVISFEKLTSTC
jgi:hypothetical protein